MEPFFAQKWLLFAPEPATNDLKLWYRLKQKDIWTSWQDPLEPILKKHQKIRFTYNAKLLYVYGNIPKDLSIKNDYFQKVIDCKNIDEAMCQKIKNDSIINSPEFRLAKRYVKKDIEGYTIEGKIDSIQIMVIQLYPKQFSDRMSNKPFGFANPTEFPSVPYDENNN